MKMLYKDTLLSQFITLILFFLIRKSFAVYVISDTTDRWVNAVNNCTLATPRITTNGNLVNTSYISNDIEMWIGYYKRSTAFEYIGCTPKDNVPITGKLLDTYVSKPSQCFPGCTNTDIIAVTAHEETVDSFNCYCLSSLPNNSSVDGCTSNCPGMTGIPCGGTDKASIYRLAPNIEIYKKEDRSNCLSIEYDIPIEYDWKSCTTQLENVLCESGNVPQSLKTRSQWSDAMNYCLSQGLMPASFNISSTRPSQSTLTDKDHWIGVFKDEVIYRYEKSADHWISGSTGIQYGYIKYRSSELGFSNDDGKKRWLCENERTTSTSSSTAKTNTPPTDNPQGPSSAGTVVIPVAVSVSVLVLILIIAFIIIFKKRMLKKTPEGRSHVIGNDEPVTCSYNYAQVQRTSENPTDCFHTQQAMNGDLNDYMYAEFENKSLATYDVTCIGGKRTDDNNGQMGNDPANVYNKLGAEEQEQTYDKTVVGKATGKTNHNMLSSDKTYDSNVSTEYAVSNTGSELTSKETFVDNIYDKSKQCDGIYNGMNENHTVNRTTDNQYGMK